MKMKLKRYPDNSYAIGRIPPLEIQANNIQFTYESNPVVTVINCRNKLFEARNHGNLYTYQLCSST